MLKNNSIISCSIISLLSIFSFVSCITTDNSIGSVYVPSDQDLKVNSVALNLPVAMKMADSLQSTSYYFSIGNNYDPTLGITSIGLAASITPSRDSIRWGTNPEFIDMYMEMGVSSISTSYSNQDYIPQNIHVYQLNFMLDSTSVYGNSITEDKYNHTPVNRGAAIYFGGDSLKIHFTKELGEQIMTASPKEMDSTALFMKKIHGIYIVADDPLESNPGGRINNFNPSTAFIYLKFKSTNNAGTRRDTTVSFILGDAKKGISLQSFRHGSSHLVNNSNNNSKVLYYEGLSGIKPFISGKEIKDLLKKWAENNKIELKHLLIARASLEFPFEFPNDYKELRHYPDGLYPCVRLKDPSGIIKYSPISEIYNDLLNRGEINRSLLYYKPDISSYLQELIKKEKPTSEDDIWMIAPYKYTETNSYSPKTYYYVDYMNYKFLTLNGNGAERNPKLVITYSVLK